MLTRFGEDDARYILSKGEDDEEREELLLRDDVVEQVVYPHLREVGRAIVWQLLRRVSISR